MTTVTHDLLATLDVRYKALKVELEEVKRLRAAIKAASSDTPAAPRKRSRTPAEGPTFKEMIKSVLADKGSGAEALEILDLIKSKFGKEIKRTSISPQLSRLKASGELILDDKTWVLPQHYAPRVPHTVDAGAYNDYLDELEADRLQEEREAEWAREQASML